MLQEAIVLSAYLEAHPVIFVTILAWSLVWKGLALWKSSRLNKPVWFVILLVVNTLGLLEILYIFVFSKFRARTKLKMNAKKKR